MKVDFFDINMYAGRSVHGTYRPAVSGEDLIGEMDNLGIKKALVWHIAQCEASAQEGNRLLGGVISESPRLYGTWAVLPPQTRELPPAEELFRQMKDKKICALRIFPEAHRFLLNRAVFGKFLDEISGRKIPVLFSLARNDITWKGLYGILAEYPGLVCVVCDTGIWGTDRYFRPLVEAYKNVYVETSMVSLGDGVMEAFVKDYGPERLVFGTGFPERVPEAAMMQLLHADIGEEEKKAIASSNCERLLAEVQL